MAQRRMFSLKIVDTDDFLDMSPTTQNLYFHLAMRADDDGFVNSPKKIMKIVNSPDDDLKVLITKQFIIPFKSGVIVIKHWKENNYIQADRYHKTIYREEMAQLKEDENGIYHLDTKCIQDVSIMDTQVRLGKVRLGKDINTASLKSDAVQFSTTVQRYFTEEYKKRFGSEPAINFAKDRKIINSTKGIFNGDEWKCLIDEFLNSDKGKRLGYSISICFSSHTINQWKAKNLNQEVQTNF